MNLGVYRHRKLFSMHFREISPISTASDAVANSITVLVPTNFKPNFVVIQSLIVLQNTNIQKVTNVRLVSFAVIHNLSNEWLRNIRFATNTQSCVSVVSRLPDGKQIAGESLRDVNCVLARIETEFPKRKKCQTLSGTKQDWNFTRRLRQEFEIVPAILYCHDCLAIVCWPNQQDCRD